MGTNYYLVKRESDDSLESKVKDLSSQHKWDGILDVLNNREETIHIGKSSCGWQFLWNHNNWKYYGYSLDSIKSFIERSLSNGWVLENEYGENQIWEGLYELYVSKLGDKSLDEDIVMYDESYDTLLRFSDVTEFC